MESEELIKKLLEKQYRGDQNKFKMERQQKVGESKFKNKRISLYDVIEKFKETLNLSKNKTFFS
jgi:hypothetical protein